MFFLIAVWTHNKVVWGSIGYLQHKCGAGIRDYLLPLSNCLLLHLQSGFLVLFISSSPNIAAGEGWNWFPLDPLSYPTMFPSKGCYLYKVMIILPACSLPSQSRMCQRLPQMPWPSSIACPDQIGVDPLCWTPGETCSLPKWHFSHKACTSMCNCIAAFSFVIWRRPCDFSLSMKLQKIHWNAWCVGVRRWTSSSNLMLTSVCLPLSNVWIEGSGSVYWLNLPWNFSRQSPSDSTTSWMVSGMSLSTVLPRPPRMYCSTHQMMSGWVLSPINIHSSNSVVQSSNNFLLSGFVATEMVRCLITHPPWDNLDTDCHQLQTTISFADVWHRSWSCFASQVLQKPSGFFSRAAWRLSQSTSLNDCCTNQHISEIKKIFACCFSCEYRSLVAGSEICLTSSMKTVQFSNGSNGHVGATGSLSLFCSTCSTACFASAMHITFSCCSLIRTVCPW